MRLTLVFVGSFVLSIGTASGQVARGNAPSLHLEFNSPITVHLSQVRLSRALNELGSRVGVQITLAPDVDDVTIHELMFVKAAFAHAFARVIHGQCLAYKITSPRSVVVTRPLRGGRSNVAGPRVVVWPDCSDEYEPPAPPEIERP
jgi:hypothetical protein